MTARPGDLSKLSLQKTEAGWTLAGGITEDADFGELLTLKNQSVKIDLGQITRINSSGTREWLKAFKALRDNGCQVTLYRCSHEIVYQLNYISNFVQGAKIASVFLPFFCESCDAEKSIEYELAGHTSDSFAMKRPCPTCQASMDFDDFPDSYFGFMAKI